MTQPQLSGSNPDDDTTESDERTILDGAAELAAFTRTCLGPDGQRKLFVLDEGYVVTDDVHRMFDEIELPHPSARFLAQHVVAQKEDVGDGSLTTLLLAGAFAAEASELLEDGLRRATIEKGYDRARDAALDALSEAGRSIGDDDGDDGDDGDDALRAVARTALNSSRPELVDVVTEATVRIAAERRSRNRNIDLSDVRFRVSDREDGPPVELVRGVVLDRDAVHERMARRLENPRVAVIGGGKKAGSGIEERTLFRSGGNKGEGRTEVSFAATDAEDLESFHEAELSQVREQVRLLSEADVDAVFCTMGISDAGKRLLDDAGITAFRALTETHAAFVARATGATVVMDIADFDADAVGTAGALTVDRDGSDATVTLSDCPGDVATLVVAGALGEYREERERDLRAAIAVLLDVLDGEPVVPGGGGIEVAMAASIRRAARSVGDRTALAMEAYADALETVPRTLARNGGADELDVLTELRAGSTLSFDADCDGVHGAFPDGPLTTARVVRTAVDGATHVVIRLLRIDDVLEGTEDDDHISLDEIDPSPVPERDFDY
jgi:chaperonin GroEL (HSP60 family)